MLNLSKFEFVAFDFGEKLDIGTHLDAMNFERSITKGNDAFSCKIMSKL